MNRRTFFKSLGALGAIAGLAKMAEAHHEETVTHHECKHENAYAIASSPVQSGNPHVHSWDARVYCPDCKRIV